MKDILIVDCDLTVNIRVVKMKLGPWTYLFTHKKKKKGLGLKESEFTKIWI